jgi:arsenate reductase
MTAHWGFQDPAELKGSEVEIRQTFARICREIKTRLDIFLSLPLNKLGKTRSSKRTRQDRVEPFLIG